MRRAAPAGAARSGFNTPWQSGTLRDLARDVVAIARDGLRARGRGRAGAATRARYLAPLEAIAAGAPTQAEHWLARYHGALAGRCGRDLAEAAIEA